MFSIEDGHHPLGEEARQGKVQLPTTFTILTWGIRHPSIFSTKRGACLPACLHACLSLPPVARAVGLTRPVHYNTIGRQKGSPHQDITDQNPRGCFGAP
jgi:hypothetical protein